MKRFSFWVLGLISGGITGTIIGLLIAPTSGKELRGRMTDYSKRAAEEIRMAADMKRQELEAELNKLKQMDKFE